MAIRIPRIDPDYIHPRRFPNLVFEAARNARLKDEVLEDRLEVQGFTIDGPYSKDLDDAIWLERSGDDWIVEVSIADVDALVRKESYVDLEAMARVQTLYQASHARTSMIPSSLSEGNLSLAEGKDRPTMTVRITLDEHLQIKDVSISKTRLKSRKRLSYEDVGAILGNSDDPMQEFMSRYYLLAERLTARRRTKGALALYDIDKGFMTNEEGSLLQVYRGEVVGNIIIQEFMILTNQAVAKFLMDNNMPALFRNHRLRHSDNVTHEGLMEQIEEAREFPELIDKISRQLRSVMDRAVYEPEADGHFGLNLPAYLHFTSPIRRYADLVVHRQVKAIIDEYVAPYETDDLTPLGAFINERIVSLERNRTSHFRARRENEIDRQLRKLSAEEIAAMEFKEFTGFLKICFATNRTPYKVWEALLIRFERGKINTYQMYLIIFKASETDEGWEDIIKAARSYLRNYPQIARSLVDEMSHQNDEWKSSSYEESNEDPICRVLVILNDKVMTSPASAIGNTKNESKLGAAVLFWEAFFDGKLIPATSQRLLDSDPISVRMNSKQEHYQSLNSNFIGDLNDLCQLNGWTVEYQEAQLKGGNKPVFTFTLTLKIKDKVYTTVTCTKSGSKQDVKRAAARQMLKKIESSSLKIVRSKPSGPSNAINSIQEIAQKRGIKLPYYSFENSGDSFVCSVNWASGGEELSFTSDEQKNKKRAKFQAAARLLFAIESGKVEIGLDESKVIPEVDLSVDHVSALKIRADRNNLGEVQYYYKTADNGFECIASLNSGASAKGTGRNKKTSKKAAAKALLELLKDPS